ncbi:MAG: hypothetical protein PVI40_01920 [Chlamydiota bacterium]|jgi:tetratricopeptide (TPR) repeat protein
MSINSTNAVNNNVVTPKSSYLQSTPESIVDLIAEHSDPHAAFRLYTLSQRAYEVISTDKSSRFHEKAMQVLEVAKDAISYIGGIEKKVRELYSLAIDHAFVGDTRLATQFLVNAESIINSAPQFRSGSYISLAKVHIQIGNFDKALVLFKKARDIRIARRFSAQELLKSTGRPLIDQLKKYPSFDNDFIMRCAYFLERMLPKWERDAEIKNANILSFIAKAYAKQGDLAKATLFFQEATNAILSCKNTLLRVSALTDLVKDFAEVGMYAALTAIFLEARDSKRTVDETHLRSYLLHPVFDALKKEIQNSITQKNYEKAEHLLQAARSLAFVFDDHFISKPDVCTSLFDIAKLYMQYNPAKAAEVVQEAMQKASEIKTLYDVHSSSRIKLYQIDLLTDAAKLQIDLGNIPLAQTMLQEIEEAVDYFYKEYPQEHNSYHYGEFESFLAKINLAKLHFSLNNLDKAEDILSEVEDFAYALFPVREPLSSNPSRNSEAEQLIQNCKDSQAKARCKNSKIMTFIELAKVYEQRGNLPKANTLLTEAIESISDLNAPVLELKSIVDRAKEFSNNEGSFQSKRLVRNLEDSPEYPQNFKINNLIDIALSYIRLNHKAAAKDLLKRAQEIISILSAPEDKMDALTKLAKAYAQLHEFEEGENLLEIIFSEELIGDLFSPSYILEVIDAYIELNNYNKARDLFKKLPRLSSAGLIGIKYSAPFYYKIKNKLENK